MNKEKITFALFFANRGFFPGELIADARKDMIAALEKNGFDYIIMDESLTRYGAVETIKEGKEFNKFLKENEGKYDGIIASLPNFGDENGASVAFKDVNVPILIQAYPDEEGKMDFAHRRDALCGKLAMCNVLRQLNIKYSLTKKFTVSPLSADFDEDLDQFAAICRVVRGMRAFNIGAIGARTTAFKTVRVDEIALANKSINVEDIDLSAVFARVDALSNDDIKVINKINRMNEISDFSKYNEEKIINISKLAVVIDDLIEEYNLHAVSIRCWEELQKKYKVAPCVILGELNERGITASCELDIANSVMMKALNHAANFPVMLLDVNNNYNDCEDKCILFHCGCVPVSLQTKPRGTIEEHLMFKKSYGEGSGVGLNVGKIQKNKVTIGSVKTENGKVCSFVFDGNLTDDPIESSFFGCGVVLEKDKINDVLRYMARNGYRHHVAVTKGQYADAVQEAFDIYLGYQIDKL